LAARRDRTCSLDGNAGNGSVPSKEFGLDRRINLNTVWGSADLNAIPTSSFNTPRDVFNPRQIQFGAKLLF
jgi:hypothetical protein